MSNLNLLSATEAVKQIAAGNISSEQLVRDCLERIAARGHFVKIRITRLPKGELPQPQLEAFYEFVVRSTAD